MESLESALNAHGYTVELVTDHSAALAIDYYPELFPYEDGIADTLRLTLPEIQFPRLSAILFPQFAPITLYHVPANAAVPSAVVNVLAGLSLYNADRCDLATPHLTSALEEERPDWAIDVSLYLGNCAAMTGDYAEAAARYGTAYENALRTRKSDYVAVSTVHLAWAELQLGHEERAFDLMDQLVENPENSPVSLRYHLTRRSQLYALAFRFDEAIADMDAAITLDPDNPYLYVERGQRILLLYQWDRALTDYNHAIELDPEYADAYYYRGILYASVPEGFDARAEAVADFQRYLDLSPDGAHTEDAQRYLTEIQAQLDAVGG